MNVTEHCPTPSYCTYWKECKNGCKMSTTEEDRIRAHYKGLKKRWDWCCSSYSALWLYLARRWQRPVREIKNIVAYHGRTDW